MKRLGLALGSGADRGFAHIGILKVFAQHNLKISCISGSSMGALIAAYYALRQDVADLEQKALELSSRDLFQLVDLNNPTISLIKGEKIRQFLIETLLGEATFSDTKIPLRIAASSLEDGSAYLFNEGKLIDAVMASSTIPGIMPPFEVDGLHLIDGGLADAIPLDALDEMGAEARVGVDLYSYQSITQEHFTAIDVVTRAYRLYLSKLSAAYGYHDDDRTIMLRPKTEEGIESLTFSRAQPNISAGEEAVNRSLQSIKSLLNS